MNKALCSLNIKTVLNMMDKFRSSFKYFHRDYLSLKTKHHPLQRQNVLFQTCYQINKGSRKKEIRH